MASSSLSEADDLQSFSLPQVNDLIRVGKPKIKEWIASGELFAFETTSRGSRRKRVRVPVWALREFMAKRAVVPQPPEKTGKKRGTSVAVQERY